MNKLIVLLALCLSVSAFAARTSKTRISRSGKSVNFDRATQIEVTAIKSDVELAGTPDIPMNGFSIAARDNYGINSKYLDYTSSAVKLTRLKGDKGVFGGKVEAKSLEASFEQRVGISKKWEQVLIRPYIAASFALQRNKGSNGFSSTSETAMDMYPSMGVEANFSGRYGASLSYTKRKTDFGDKVIANNDMLTLGFNYAL